MGVRVHQLPEKPSDVDDDGKFHFAVLGPAAVSESGKPSAFARRFLDETTSAAKPRVYRNAVILVVPSKDGLDVVRSRIADLLAWEQVEFELRQQAQDGSVDAQRMQRLTVELEKARKLAPDAIRQAWCMMVTVSEANDIQSLKLTITDEPLFASLKADPRSRLQETKITAESLLPMGRMICGRKATSFGGSRTWQVHSPRCRTSQPNEIQDFADTLADILAMQAKHGVEIRYSLSLEVTNDGAPMPEVSAELRKLLEKVSEAFHRVTPLPRSGTST